MTLLLNLNHTRSFFLYIRIFKNSCQCLPVIRATTPTDALTAAYDRNIVSEETRSFHANRHSAVTPNP